MCPKCIAKPGAGGGQVPPLGGEALQHGPKGKTFLLLKMALQAKPSPSRDGHGGAWSALGLSGVDFFTKADFLSEIRWKQ